MLCKPIPKHFASDTKYLELAFINWIRHIKIQSINFWYLNKWSSCRPLPRRPRALPLSFVAIYSMLVVHKSNLIYACECLWVYICYIIDLFSNRWICLPISYWNKFLILKSLHPFCQLTQIIDIKINPRLMTVIFSYSLFLYIHLSPLLK